MKANENPHPEDWRERQGLAERLKEAREYLGFSQEEVAKFLGIARTALSNIETGQRRVEAIELKRLAQLYKRPVAYFTGEELDDKILSEEIEHLARRASALSAQDRGELARFAEFLHARKQTEGC